MGAVRLAGEAEDMVQDMFARILAWPRLLRGEDETAYLMFPAIAQLPERFRLALVAVDIVGLSYREAAGALGTTEATITTRVYRVVTGDA